MAIKNNIEFVDEKSQDVLPIIEADYVEENYTGEWYNYLRINLSELEDGDEYEGKPLLTEIEKVQFDEEEAPQYRCRLLLLDDENEEYLQINIKVKSTNDVQTNIHHASTLYALLASINDLNNPGWSSNFNHIKSVNLEDWRNYLDNKELMSIKVVEKTGSNFTYNSFRVTSLS